MGQYHKIVNLDKREFFDHYAFGSGAKLLEQHGSGSASSALHLLLACSSGRGGGDYQSDPWHKDGNPDAVVGRWAGDRIAIVGDYAEDTDLAPEHGAGTIYTLCLTVEDREKHREEVEKSGGRRPTAEQERSIYDDITHLLVPVMEREFECVYVGDGWKNRIELFEVLQGPVASHGIGDRTICFDGVEVPFSKLKPAVEKVLEDETLMRGVVYGQPVPMKLTAQVLGFSKRKTRKV